MSTVFQNFLQDAASHNIAVPDNKSNIITIIMTNFSNSPIFIEYFLCVKSYARCFVCCISSNCSNNLVKQVLLSVPFYRWINWGSQLVNSSSEVGKISLQSEGPCTLYSIPLPFIHRLIPVSAYLVCIKFYNPFNKIWQESDLHPWKLYLCKHTHEKVSSEWHYSCPCGNGNFFKRLMFFFK